MCGLVGIASITQCSQHAWLVSGRDDIAHRGPDDAGEWWSEDGRVGLAHRRLSIIDLSPTGHQPMADITGKLRIVFNGEIYNFSELRRELASKGAVFRSQSDTEVILAAYNQWGLDCLAHLNGMFVFALYDMMQRTIFIARDRAGEKPLFYYYTNGILRFGSELKALFADNTLPRHVDPEALDCYLAMGYMPGEKCILKGFQKLPPAHAMLFSLKTGEIKKWRYWRLPELQPTYAKCVNELELINDLESLMEDAVNRQLIADVPVGVLLSGGLDSSLVTAMAVRASSKVKTFTIRFPNHSKFDETKHARLIARHFGTEHTELEAQPSTINLLPRLARQFDEPMVDSSMIPTFLVSRLVRRHCAVALGGDGGDELFGGYHHYSRLIWMQQHLGIIPHSIRNILSKTAEWLLPVGFKGRNWLQGLGADLRFGLPLIATYFDAITRRQLMSRYGNWPTVAEFIVAKRIPATPDLLQRATRMDFTHYLVNDILTKVDRASMLNSLEVRAPLLDYRLIEFAFGKVPSQLKATRYNRKILLKFLAARVLPKEFDRNRKQGFSIPMAAWLNAGKFRNFFQDILLDPRSIFDLPTILSLFKGQDHGCNNSERLFALVLFELWRREYAVSF
jgi:asparagine synthase (glutamine-hydrolysing)